MGTSVTRCWLALVGVLWASSAAAAKLSWWQDAVLYQIYPRSFQDTDGNGIGDLEGIYSRVEYLKDLGVTGIWINPIYDSPLKDFGYDISDYMSIDTTFGSFDDFAKLVNKIHNMGMKILVDMVPNHTSDQHKWFQEALKGNKTYQDYYVFQTGTEHYLNKNTPPNNWVSVMGGSAWEWDDNLKQFYYHAFLKEQPDLNYRNPHVVENMKDVLKFWLDHGVDGFRVDAVPFLVEDSQLRNEESCGPGCLTNKYTQNLPETYFALQQLYDVIQNYNNTKYPGEKIMVLEVYADIQTVQNYFYYNSTRTSTMPFNFQMIGISMETTGQNIYDMVNTWETNLIQGGWSNWVTGNHDQNRVGHKVGVPMTDGMNMLVLLLPGTSFSYYGEELGLDDTYVDCAQMQDTQALRQANGDCGKLQTLSRDPERTPMPWNNSANAGFSWAQPWLPVNPDFPVDNVEKQKSDSESHLNLYKKLIKIKKEMAECQNMTTAVAANGTVFGFKRFNCGGNNTGEYVVVVNFNNDMSSVSLGSDLSATDELYVRATSRTSDKKIGDKISLDNLKLRAKEGIVLSTVASSSLAVVPSAVLLLSSLLLYLLRSSD